MDLRYLPSECYHAAISDAQKNDMSDFGIAVLAGLGGMLGWGIADFFAKKTIDELGDILSLVWAHIFGCAIFLVCAIIRVSARDHTVATPDGWSAWIYVLLFGVLQAIVYLLVYKGFGKGQVAVLNPVFASFSGLTAALSIAFFGEIIRGPIFLTLAVIFAGTLMLGIDTAALRNRRISFGQVPGLPEIAAAIMLAAIWTVLWYQFVNGRDWFWYAFYMYMFMTITLWMVAKLQRVRLVVPELRLWFSLFLIGAFEAGAYVSISLGYSATTRTSVVALLSGAFSLPTIVLARSFLKESVSPLQTAGSVVVIAGIMLLAVV
jgi:drug/metabolite transporter (DMT)-like permease